MNKKNITIIAFITIFGIGLFVTIFNLLGSQTSNLKSSESSKIDQNTATPTVIMEAKKPVKQIDPPTAEVNQKVNAQPTTETKTTNTNSTYKNGTYNATISYRVPEGNTEKISTAVTIEEDIIKAIKNNNEANNRTSREYQGDFESRIQSAAVGKKIDSLSLDAVGGASLTTGAFVKAIAQIQTQAKS
jgi:uncharacterized protein with FMN-binding domain